MAHLIQPPRAEFIDLPMPQIGNKGWLLERKGLFVLERGPCTLRAINTPHAGSSTGAAIEVLDGVPDEAGYFAPVPNQHPLLPNGRRIVNHYPIPMGCWMYDIGLIHGLSVLHWGGEESISTSTTLAWYPFKSLAAASGGGTPGGKKGAPFDPKKGKSFESEKAPPAPKVMNGLKFEEVFAPAAPGSLKRGASISESGVFRLARRTSEFYSILVPNPGAWASLEVRDGYNRPVWRMPTTFTGSFVSGIELEGGVIVEAFERRGVPAQFTVSWREPDQLMV